MNNESFMDVVRQQYAEKIHSAYLECEHEDGRNVDFAKLNTTLARLMKNAKVEGLPQKDFEDLVKSTLPDVFARINLKAA